MLFPRYGTFAGGIDLPDEKADISGLSIEPSVLVAPLRVALAPCGGPAAKLLVEVGQSVSAGQMIGQRNSTDSVDVFAPVEGKVTALTSVLVAGRDNFLESPAVEIEPAGESFEIPSPKETFDWRMASGEELFSRLRAAGLTTYCRPIRPLQAWLERAMKKGCKTLIANAMEDQPMVCADHRLLVERGGQVMAGLAILARAMRVDETHLAVDVRRTAEYRQIASAARKYNINSIALPNKYPTGSDRMLVKILTRRETPPGKSTMDVGAAVVTAATCLAVYLQVACDIPATGRIVTVAGQRAPEVKNRYVPFGTRCIELVQNAEQPIVHNGPMIGLRCPSDAVVTPATDAVLALETSIPPAASPCIRCSWCTDHCPARLNVAGLNDAYELGSLDRARRLMAPACVECGLCTYICPARLPLAQRTKQLKRALSGVDASHPLFAGK